MMKKPCRGCGELFEPEDLSLETRTGNPIRWITDLCVSCREKAKELPDTFKQKWADPY